MDLSRAVSLMLLVPSTEVPPVSVRGVSQPLPEGYELAAVRGFQLTDTDGKPVPVLGIWPSTATDNPSQHYVNMSLPAHATTYSGQVLILIAPVD